MLYFPLQVTAHHPHFNFPSRNDERTRFLGTLSFALSTTILVTATFYL